MSRRWRIGSVVAVVAVFAWLTASNFVSEERRTDAWWWPDSVMRLGLDLQGGIHMVIGPDLEAAIAHELSVIRSSLEQDLEREDVSGVDVVVAGDRVRVDAPGPERLEQVRDVLDDYQTVTVEEVGEAGLRLGLTGDWQREVEERAMLQVLEVLRRRVNDPQTGIPESVVTRQGRDQILVQIPGVSRVPDIFGQTGFLEFKIVRDVAPSEELLRARHEDGLPPGTEIVTEVEEGTDRVLSAYLVSEEAPITGDSLEDARVGFDGRRNEWVVSFTWSSDGAAVFAELTEENLGKPLAIILDDQVYSAPTIQARISRQGEITGNFSSQDASDLAVILRAGALPIPVQIEEERTIGPALGADSIRAGVRASILGLLLVVAFAVGYYRLSGGYASVALLVNLVLLIGLMSMFEGTLTLPGIAGLVLTVGMAIDANVIIFERIREELRAGRAPRAAVASGFQKARWTILDANITTLITALVLFQYGTGPIKGFAVTLSAGILTSVFSALVVTRLLYDIHPGQRNVAELSI